MITVCAFYIFLQGIVKFKKNLNLRTQKVTSYHFYIAEDAFNKTTVTSGRLRSAFPVPL